MKCAELRRKFAVTAEAISIEIKEEIGSGPILLHTFFLCCPDELKEKFVMFTRLCRATSWLDLSATESGRTGSETLKEGP